MLRPVAAAGPLLRPDDERHVHVTAQQPADLGRLVAYLVHRQHGEVDVHVLDHGAEARQGGADAQAREAGLRDGGVAHPVGAELVEQPAGDAEHPAATPDADVFTDEHDGRVAPHLLAQGLTQRLGVTAGPRARGLGRAGRARAARLCSLRGAHENNPSRTVETSGSGLPTANSTAASTADADSRLQVSRSADEASACSTSSLP